MSLLRSSLSLFFGLRPLLVLLGISAIDVESNEKTMSRNLGIEKKVKKDFPAFCKYFFALTQEERDEALRDAEKEYYKKLALKKKLKGRIRGH